MSKGSLIVVIGIIIVFIFPVLGVIYGEEYVVGEKLCVDGEMNKNLEGIMCEETEFDFLGMGIGWFVFLTLLFSVIGFIIFSYGIFYDDPFPGGFQ